jgi:hypothetical protein
MRELSTFAIILVGAAGVMIFAFLVILWIQKTGYAYRVLYEDLKSFKYYVENTPINNVSHGNIINRIKTERARKEMCEKRYCNLLDEITLIFVKRFADFIQDRGSKNIDTVTQQK